MAGDNLNGNGRGRDASPSEEHEAFIRNHNERMRKVDRALEGLQKLTKKAKGRRPKEAASGG